MVSSDSVRKDEHSIGVEMPYEFLEGSSLESRMSSKGRSLSSQLSHLSKMKRGIDIRYYNFIIDICSSKKYRKNIRVIADKGMYGVTNKLLIMIDIDKVIIQP